MDGWIVKLEWISADRTDRGDHFKITMETVDIEELRLGHAKITQNKDDEVI